MPPFPLSLPLVQGMGRDWKWISIRVLSIMDKPSSALTRQYITTTLQIMQQNSIEEISYGIKKKLPTTDFFYVSQSHLFSVFTTVWFLVKHSTRTLSKSYSRVRVMVLYLNKVKTKNLTKKLQKRTFAPLVRCHQWFLCSPNNPKILKYYEFSQHWSTAPLGKNTDTEHISSFKDRRNSSQVWLLLEL